MRRVGSAHLDCGRNEEREIEVVGLAIARSHI